VYHIVFYERYFYLLLIINSNAETAGSCHPATPLRMTAF